MRAAKERCIRGGFIVAEMLRGAGFRQSSWLVAKLALRFLGGDLKLECFLIPTVSACIFRRLLAPSWSRASYALVL